MTPEERRAERARKARQAAEQRAHETLGATMDVSAQVEAAIAVRQDRQDRYQGPLRWVRLDSLESSPNQRRASISIADVATLVTDIRARGLMSLPVVRLTTAGAEIIAGHRRVAALRQIAVTTSDIPDVLRDVLRIEVDGTARIAAVVRSDEALLTHGLTIAENLQRADLSPWELALTLDGYRRAMADATQRLVSVNQVVDALSLKYSTMAPYFRIAECLTPDVLVSAGVPVGEQGYRLLGEFTQQQLTTIVRSGDPQTYADTLRAAILRKQQTSAKDQVVSTATEAATGASATPSIVRSEPVGYQINIRYPIDQVRPVIAARHVVSMAVVLRQLIEQCGSALEPASAAQVQADLEKALEQLRVSSRVRPQMRS